MTVFITVAKRVGIIETSMPVRVERWAEDQMSIEARPRNLQEKALAQGGHLVSRRHSVPRMAP